MGKKTLQENEKLLILPPEGIGDNLMFLPTAYVLKNNFPNCQITFLSNKNNGASKSVRYSQYVDNIIEMDFKSGKINYLDFILHDYLPTISKINSFNFTKILTIKKNLFRTLITIPFYFKTIESKIFDINQIDFSMKTIENFENITSRKFPTKLLNENPDYSVLQNFNLEKKYICVSLSSNSKSRSIPYKRDLISIIQEELGTNYDIVLIGNDKDYTENKNIRNLINKTSIHELLNLIKFSDLTISVDSSILHMAIYQDIPTLGLFGSVKSKYRVPKNPNSKLICIDYNKNDTFIESLDEYLHSKNYFKDLDPNEIISKTKLLLN